MQQQVPIHKQGDLAAAITEFEERLPGWWWKVGSCSVSADASCGPDRQGPDARMLKERRFDGGFHLDCHGRDWTVAETLGELTRMAVLARSKFLLGEAQSQ